MLAVLAVAAELVSPRLAESRIEAGVRQKARNAASVEADIDSFPFLPRLLLEGRIRNLTITLREVVQQRLTITTVRFGLGGVQLDREALLQRRIRVTDIDSGTVTAEITGDALTSLLGPVTLPPGTRLPAGTFPVSSDLFPCQAVAEVASAQRVTVTCTLQEPPPFLSGGEGISADAAGVSW